MFQIRKQWAKINRAIVSRDLYGSLGNAIDRTRRFSTLYTSQRSSSRVSSQLSLCLILVFFFFELSSSSNFKSGSSTHHYESSQIDSEREKRRVKVAFCRAPALLCGDPTCDFVSDTMANLVEHVNEVRSRDQRSIWGGILRDQRSISEQVERSKISIVLSRCTSRRRSLWRTRGSTT